MLAWTQMENIFWSKTCLQYLENLGLKRLVDIIDNVDNEKLSTNIFVVEYSFDLIWPNVRACNIAVWPACMVL